MRAIIQRVLRGDVQVDGQTVGRVGRGLLVYVGVAVTDTKADAEQMAEKIAALRIFDDKDGKLNLSVRDARGGVLAVPNFTLLADARKGRRPAFVDAAGPDAAKALFEAFVAALLACECTVATGPFGASMVIHSAADGPVNIVLDLPGGQGPRAGAAEPPNA